MSVDLCREIDLPMIPDFRGNLSFVEGAVHVPFDIKRIYYLYNVPEFSERGSHAHKKLHQLIIPISGNFDITIDDGINKRKINMNRPNIGFYICPMIWRTINNFSSSSICLVLASEYYSEIDYIRDYEQFLLAANGN
jgi:hypothetical protein